MINPMNIPMGAGIARIPTFVSKDLKGDVRRMARGNIPKVDKSLKSSNVVSQHDIGRIDRAMEKAINIYERMEDDKRIGELTPDKLSNLNNKIALLNQQLPRNMEIPEVLGGFKKGGNVKKTGLYQLHKGEKVIPAKDVKKNKKKN
tara:strand:+ start:9059 stop:9496 length:438 start_codon:yes stop_codon:yes gene_type:complete